MVEAYLDSKIGKIPTDWELEKIEDLGTSARPAVKAGPFGSSLKKDFYVERGYKVYGQEQVISGDAFYGNYYIDSERFHMLQSCEVQPNDILLSLVGTLGSVLVIPENAEKGIINPRLLRISLDSARVHTMFAKYWLQSEKMAILMQRHSHGGTMDILNAGIVKSLPIPLPPLEEQRAIADILGTWDEAIALAERLIDALQERKKGLMQKLLTGEVRFSEFDGEWEEVRLGEIAKIVMGQSPPGSSYNSDGVGVPLLNGPTEFNDRYPVPQQWTSKPRKMCQEGDILLCVRGSSTGRMNIADQEYCIGRGVGAISAKTNSSTRLLEHILNYGIQKILSRTAGSTFPNIDSKSLRSIPVIVSEYNEQAKIAEVIDLALLEMAILHEYREILQQQKKGLMQQLLTGQVRVKV